MSLFQNIVLKKYLAAEREKIAAAYRRFADYFYDPDRREKRVDSCWVRVILNTSTTKYQYQPEGVDIAH